LPGAQALVRAPNMYRSQQRIAPAAFRVLAVHEFRPSTSAHCKPTQKLARWGSGTSRRGARFWRNSARRAASGRQRRVSGVACKNRGGLVWALVGGEGLGGALARDGRLRGQGGLGSRQRTKKQKPESNCPPVGIAVDIGLKHSAFGQRASGGAAKPWGPLGGFRGVKTHGLVSCQGVPAGRARPLTGAQITGLMSCKIVR